MATVTAAKPDGVYDANPFEMRMRPAQWIDLPAFPGQRYTYGRLARALRGHLSRPSPTHARVAAVLLPDGVIYKLDGHTRALAWHLGYLPAPETILVDVYRADSAEQARALYAAFDNPASTKNASDRVYAALRETGLVDYLKTPWLQHGRFATALRMIGDHASTVDTVERFSPALLQIDSLRPTRRRFPSGVLAAAIATAHVHGDRSIEQFWAPYSQDQGAKTSAGYDPPLALAFLVRERSAGHHGGQSAATDLCRRALYAHDQCLMGRRVKRLMLGPELRDYLKE